MAEYIGLFIPKLDSLDINKDCCSSSSSLQDAAINSKGKGHEKETSCKEQILKKWLKT